MHLDKLLIYILLISNIGVGTILDVISGVFPQLLSGLVSEWM